MKMQIVVIRDIKANVHQIPIYTHNIGAAIRSFGDECQRDAPDNILHKHPEDFELWWLGEYDDETGSHDTEADGRTVQRKQLAVGSNYKR